MASGVFMISLLLQQVFYTMEFIDDKINPIIFIELRYYCLLIVNLCKSWLSCIFYFLFSFTSNVSESVGVRCVHFAIILCTFFTSGFAFILSFGRAHCTMWHKKIYRKTSDERKFSHTMENNVPLDSGFSFLINLWFKFNELIVQFQFDHLPFN